MRPSLLLALAFFCALVDHAQAANDHRTGCARFFNGQHLPNCKGQEGTSVWGTQQVAQASSRTGGYDLYPGGGSPGGVPAPGEIYHPYNEHSGGSNVGGEYPTGYGNPGGSSAGGSSVGGSSVGGSNPGGSNSAGSGP
jgi:hypothetical protein